MVSGYDLRINLSYFIGKSYEKEIMNKINETSKEYSGFNVRFFYSEQDNLTSKLKDFAKRYDGKVNFSIRISSTEYQQINDVYIQSRPIFDGHMIEYLDSLRDIHRMIDELFEFIFIIDGL